MRDFCADGNLPGNILAQPRTQDIPDNDLVDGFGADTGTGQGGFGGNGPQTGRRNRSQPTQKASLGCSGSGNNTDTGHRQVS